MENIEREDRTSVRSTKATNTGYTGLSLLHRLHSLYGFDIFKDIVYDGMHNIPLNDTKIFSLSFFQPDRRTLKSPMASTQKIKSILLSSPVQAL